MWCASRTSFAVAAACSASRRGILLAITLQRMQEAFQWGPAGSVQVPNGSPAEVVEHHLLAQMVRPGQEHAPLVNGSHLVGEGDKARIGIEHKGVDDDPLLLAPGCF